MEEFAISVFGTPAAMGLSVLALLSALLLIAAAHDLRGHRIPNILILCGALLAIALHTILPRGDGFLSLLPGALGPWGALKGLLIGLVVLLPLYLLRGLSAGDVKLMAMTGAFLGSPEIWWAIFSTFLAGGVLVLAAALRPGVAAQTLKNLRIMLASAMLRTASGGAVSIPAPPSATRLPYGLAIAGGTIVCMIYRAVQLNMI
ncbi:Type IV leader peptidase family protein [Azoarcus sp. Aa7]|nr:Type IV leader peptidase family protein [Azoarcus sp. Aa7]